jgi:spermidine synthase
MHCPPDEAVTALVRARLPFARGVRVRIRPVDGRSGVAGLAAGSADVLVLDAFAGGRVPAELTSVEFMADVARVLRPGGVLLANVADGPPGTYARRLTATVQTALPHAALLADPAVLKRRRFGNVVLAASRAGLPLAAIRRAAAGAMFPRRVLAGAALSDFVAGAALLTDAEPVRSPQPPDVMWRLGG